MADQTKNKRTQFCNHDNVIDFENINPNTYNDHLKIFHRNIRSLQRNHSLLENFIHSSKISFDVLALSETWLKDNDCFDNLFTEYKCLKSSTSINKSSGVAIYVSKKLIYTKLNTIKLDNSEYLGVEIKMENNIIFNIHLIYRHPNGNLKIFFEDLKRLIKSLNKNQNNLILGDINIDLNNINHNDVLTYNDIMHKYGLFPLILLPTRVTNNHQSLLDHMFFNNPNLCKIQSGNLIDEDTDHYGNYCFMVYL